MDSSRAAHVIAASTNIAVYLQADAWQGRIAAVFHRSILCTTPDEHLLHLHIGPCLVSPFSLRVEDDFADLLHTIPLVQGMPVRKIGLTMDIAEEVHLRLDKIAYYQSPRHLSGALEPKAVRHARQTLRSHGRAGGFDGLVSTQEVVTALTQALVNRNAAHMLEATRHVIGLGPGLTPSGDDFLVGCLRGLWLLHASAPGACQMFSCLRDALRPDLDARTTRVGAEFIRYALDGAFAEVLDQAALALLAPSTPEVVQSAVNRLLAQGETSGTDTMLGCLTCLEALLPTLDPEPHPEWHAMPSTGSTPVAARG